MRVCCLRWISYIDDVAAIQSGFVKSQKVACRTCTHYVWVSVKTSTQNHNKSNTEKSPLVGIKLREDKKLVASWELRGTRRETNDGLGLRMGVD